MDFFDIIRDMRKAGWSWYDIQREFDEAKEHVEELEDEDDD